MKFFGEVVVTLPVIMDPRVLNGAQVACFVLALGTVIVVLCLAMRFCGVVKRVLRDSGAELITRISGLPLSAVAVQLAAEGVRAFVKQG